MSAVVPTHAYYTLLLHSTEYSHWCQQWLPTHANYALLLHSTGYYNYYHTVLRVHLPTISGSKPQPSHRTVVSTYPPKVAAACMSTAHVTHDFIYYYNYSHWCQQFHHNINESSQCSQSQVIPVTALLELEPLKIH